MSYATELHTGIEFENHGNRLIANCPDGDDEMSITIRNRLHTRTLYTMTLDEAQELGEFLIEHVKNAINK